MGVRLGELVAIRALQDITRIYNEDYPDDFKGFELRTFGGTTITITPDGAFTNSVSTIQGFTVFLSEFDRRGVPLYNNAVLDLPVIDRPDTIRVRATTFPTTLGSVRFELDGDVVIDNDTPYEIGVRTDRSATYVLTATPFSERDATGIGGVPFTVRFTINIG